MPTSEIAENRIAEFLPEAEPRPFFSPNFEILGFFALHAVILWSVQMKLCK